MPFVRYAAVAVLLAFTRCAGNQSAKASATPTAADPHQVVIWEYKFQPQTLAVSAGTTVRWVNRDMTPHTATHKTYSEESFDSGTMTSNQEFMHTFTTPGTYSYLCILHQGMTGTIVVQ